MSTFRFVVFIFASLVAFLAILRVANRRDPARATPAKVGVVAAVICVGGMVFAKWGATAGLPWVIYYGVPAALTVLLPPIAFRLRGRALVEYLVMASLVAPVIHVAFSFLLGWHEYMPFIHVPSPWDSPSG